MHKVLATLSFAAGMLLPHAWGQGLSDQMNFFRSNAEGFHIYGLTAFSGYVTHRFPLSSSQSSLANLNSRLNYGASVTLGWQRFRGATNVTFRYSGIYSGESRYTDLNSFNSSAALNVSRRLGRKWSVGISATAQNLTYAQYIFDPSSLGTLSQSQASADDVAAALSVGRFTTPQAESLLGEVPAPLAPTDAVLLGNRVLTYGVQASANYEATSRLSFQVGSFAMGGEYLRDSTKSGLPDNYVTPRTTGGNANASMSYSLSPRTTLGLGVGENYVRSHYQRSTATAVDASLSRRMGMHWFVRAYLGGAFMENIQQDTGTAPSHQMIGGGSIGFRTYANTLIGTFARSSYDPGLGIVGHNSLASAAWNWNHPRKSWGLHAIFNRNKTTGTGFGGLDGWRVTAGFTKALNWDLGLNISYAYLDSRGVFVGLTDEVIVQSLRLSISWTPRLRREHSTFGIDDAGIPGVIN